MISSNGVALSSHTWEEKFDGDKSLICLFQAYFAAESVHFDARCNICTLLGHRTGLRQLRTPVLIVQKEKGHPDQELGDVPDYRKPISDLRGILDVKDDGDEHTRAYRNFGDMSIHIGTEHWNKRMME